MNSANKYLTILLIIFIGALSIVNFVMLERNFSEAENRVLAKKPILSWNNLISGKFTTQYEEYIIDQFAFRDFWVSAKSISERLLQKKDNNGVYFGKDGYLLEKAERRDDLILARNLEAINKFAANLDSLPVHFLLAPNSAEILEDKLPPFAPVNKLEVLKKAQEKLSSAINLIDVSDIFSAKQDQGVYYKTDHHWTTLGAFYAYQGAGKEMGFEAWEIDDFVIEIVSESFLGTLYSRSGVRFINPDSMEIFKPKEDLSYKVEYLANNKVSQRLYEFEHLKKKDKYAVFLDGNHPLIKITGPMETGKSLLVLKDSYAHSLVPFLANHYEEIHMLDLRYYNLSVKEYIEDHDLDEILLVYNTTSLGEDNSLIKLGLINR